MELLKTVETFIVNTEAEGDEIIQDARANTSYELTDSSIGLKVKKSKGEIVDSHYLVTVKKKYCNEWED